MLLLLAAALGWAGPARAGVPRLINFQGRLAGANGAVLTGTYNLTFALWSAPTAGSSCFSETQSVAITNGMFDVNIGAATSGGVSASCVFTAQYYLELTVGTDGPMAPRIQLTSAAYAFNADTLNGYSAGNGAGQIPVSNGVVNANLNAAMVGGQTGPFQSKNVLHTMTCQTLSGSPAPTCPAGYWFTGGGGTGCSTFGGTWAVYNCTTYYVRCCTINNP
ncbi:MAG TPA: hypothetical protein VFF06_26030 [Polyangia bacterium]|nr:hypothetical protein [Polyangia bacterium]